MERSDFVKNIFGGPICRIIANKSFFFASKYGVVPLTFLNALNPKSDLSISVLVSPPRVALLYLLLFILHFLKYVTLDLLISNDSLIWYRKIIYFRKCKMNKSKYNKATL